MDLVLRRPQLQHFHSSTSLRRLSLIINQTFPQYLPPTKPHPVLFSSAKINLFSTQLHTLIGTSSAPFILQSRDRSSRRDSRTLLLYFPISKRGSVFRTSRRYESTSQLVSTFTVSYGPRMRVSPFSGWKSTSYHSFVRQYTFPPTPELHASIIIIVIVVYKIE
jgi:hypothetical protein